MKLEKNFTTGLFSGVLAFAILFVIMGYSGTSTESIVKYEFYDLNTTQGLIFNKATGEIKYETIREKPFSEHYSIDLTIKGDYPSYPIKFEIDND